MKPEPTDRIELRQFLLGDCTDEERERVEERLMTDDSYFEEFELVLDINLKTMIPKEYY